MQNDYFSRATGTIGNPIFQQQPRRQRNVHELRALYNQQHDSNHCHLYAIDQSSRSVLMITVMIIIATSTNVILTMMRPMRMHVIKNIEKESYRLVDIIVVVVVVVIVIIIIIIIIIIISISMFFNDWHLHVNGNHH